MVMVIGRDQHMNNLFLCAKVKQCRFVKMKMVKEE